MSNFNNCINFVLENEGGFIVDVGGPTNFGITAKYLMQNALWKYDINKDGCIDQSEMRRFSKKDAVQVYKGLFMLHKYHRINSDDLAMRVFDMCVNAGHSVANKMLQDCYNSLTNDNKLAVDGVVGKDTLAKINTFVNTSKLINAYKNARALFYLHLAERDSKKYGKYLQGWLNRANK